MKLNKYYGKIQAIYGSLDELLGELEEKQDAIAENAIGHYREMTDKEQERYDEIDKQIQAIEACKDELEYAMSEIEEYTD